MNMGDEKKRQKALQVNYALGNYGKKQCQKCGFLIDRYDDAVEGFCNECRDEVNNY